MRIVVFRDWSGNLPSAVYYDGSLCSYLSESQVIRLGFCHEEVAFDSKGQEYEWPATAEEARCRWEKRT